LEDLLAFVPCLDTAQVSLGFTQYDGEFAENVWNVQRSAAWTAAELTVMAQCFMDWWYTGDGSHTYRGYMGTGTHLLQAVARDLTTQHSHTVTVSADETSNTGTQTGAPFANGLTWSITSRTGLSGRNYRGRTFIIGLTEDNVNTSDRNQIASGATVGLMDAFGALITAVPAADATCTLVVASKYYQPGGPLTPTVPRAAGVMTPITSFGYHNLFLDYQRRRAPAHNRHH
jgi:hypothetical protein